MLNLRLIKKQLNDGFVSNSNAKLLIKEIEKYRNIIDDLPKTADGVLLKLSMRIWYWHYSGEIRDALIRMIGYWNSSIPVIYTFDYDEKAPLKWDEIYSTKEAIEEVRKIKNVK